MLSLRIALRYLFSRKSHSAVNIISFISLAGVAVATVAVVTVLSVFNGFSQLALDRLSLMDPQIKVTRSDAQVIDDTPALLEKVTAIDGVATALPTLTGQALAVYHDKQMPVRIKGVTPGYELMTGLRDLVIDGEYISPDDNPLDSLPGYAPRQFASLSVGVAANLVSPTGFYDLMGIYVPRRIGNINPANPLGAFAADSVMVSSVFRVEQPEYDADLIILPLETVRALLEYDDESTAIEIALSPTANDADVAKSLKASLGDEYKVETRIEQQQDSFRMIQVEKWISFLLLAFILIIASFNIISTLSILIIEKEDNIVTMTALGAPRRLLSRIFMTQGWLISTGGGVVGIIVGVALCLVQQLTGVIKLSGDAVNLAIEAYPVKVEAVDLLAVLALVALVGLLSTAVTRRFIRARI